MVIQNGAVLRGGSFSKDTWQKEVKAMTFTYCGKAPEDFGCYYIPDEDQISDMMSEYE